MTSNCDGCLYYTYDSVLDEYLCTAYLDEDEFYCLTQRTGPCPYYRPGDDYALVRRQN